MQSAMDANTHLASFSVFEPNCQCNLVLTSGCNCNVLLNMLNMWQNVLANKLAIPIAAHRWKFQTGTLHVPKRTSRCTSWSNARYMLLRVRCEEEPMWTRAATSQNSLRDRSPLAVAKHRPRADDCIFHLFVSSPRCTK